MIQKWISIWISGLKFHWNHENLSFLMVFNDLYTCFITSSKFENPYKTYKTWRVQGSRATASRVGANKRMKRWDIITHYLYPKQQYSKGNNEQARAKQICIIVPVESRLIIKYIRIRHMSGKWQYTDDISETNLYDNRISKNYPTHINIISRITLFHNRFNIFNRL